MAPIKKAHGVHLVNTRSIIVFLGLIGLLQIAAWTHIGFTQGCQPGRPLTTQEVLELLRVRGKPLSAKNKILIQAVNCRKVDFDLKGYEAELRNAGATKELLSVISLNRKPPEPIGPLIPSPTPTPSPTAPPTPIPSPTQRQTADSTPPASPSPSPPTPSPTPPPAGTQVKTKSGLELNWIPPGQFEMGSETGSADERPVHRVTFAEGFFMGKHEVTIAEWKTVMHDIPDGMKKGLGDKFNMSERQPVVRVSWDEAKTFIIELNKRGDGYTYGLPTEAQWEYACRAGTTEDLIANPSAIAWYSSNSQNHTHDVETKRHNAWGLYDMHGNVWEWCEDLYHEDYNSAPKDGSDWLIGGVKEKRVRRGGSWKLPARDLRSTNRLRTKQQYQSETIGFRVVAVAQR